VWASGCLGTWDGNGHDGGQSLPLRGPPTLTGGADRVSVRMPDRSQPTLTGVADRVGVRMPDSGQTSTSYASRRQSTWPQGRGFRP